MAKSDSNIPDSLKVTAYNLAVGTVAVFSDAVAALAVDAITDNPKLGAAVGAGVGKVVESIGDSFKSQKFKSLEQSMPLKDDNADLDYRNKQLEQYKKVDAAVVAQEQGFNNAEKNLNNQELNVIKERDDLAKKRADASKHNSDVMNSSKEVDWRKGQIKQEEADLKRLEELAAKNPDDKVLQIQVKNAQEHLKIQHNLLKSDEDHLKKLVDMDKKKEQLHKNASGRLQDTVKTHTKATKDLTKLDTDLGKSADKLAKAKTQADQVTAKSAQTTTQTQIQADQATWQSKINLNDFLQKAGTEANDVATKFGQEAFDNITKSNMAVGQAVKKAAADQVKTEASKYANILFLAAQKDLFNPVTFPLGVVELAGAGAIMAAGDALASALGSGSGGGPSGGAGAGGARAATTTTSAGNSASASAASSTAASSAASSAGGNGVNLNVVISGGTLLDQNTLAKMAKALSDHVQQYGGTLVASNTFTGTNLQPTS